MAKDKYLTPDGIPIAEMRQPSFTEISADNRVVMNGYLNENGTYYIERTIISVVNDVQKFHNAFAKNVKYEEVWSPTVVWCDMNTGNPIGG